MGAAEGRMVVNEDTNVNNNTHTKKRYIPNIFVARES